MKLLRCSILFSFLIISISCKKPVEEPKVLLPSNLKVTITEDPDNYGLVSISATATNANFYSFIFHDVDDSTIIESDKGEEIYEYTKSGNFKIGIKAHTSHTDFIRKNESVDILFPVDDPNFQNDTSGYKTPLSYPNYILVWNDEFNGGSLSESDWNFEIGNGNNGWGNNELQYYLKENLTVENGKLIIEARNTGFNGYTYTSSRITTQNKQSFKYGRIDIRAKLPYGQGLWPALWMLGNNISTVGWPACGEIDIMEMVGGANSDNTVHGTAHWSQNGHAQYGQSTKLNSGILADQYHVYSIIWNSNSIRWYFDDKLYNEIDITPNELSEFHQNFFFIFNVAVGGNWPGSPDANTSFPQKMFVDYIRVFQ